MTHVRREAAGGGVIRELDRRDERARDGERVVALAEEEVQHLDRRLVAIGREETGDRIDRDRAVADAARVEAGLVERARTQAAVSAEVERLRHVQAGDRGRGHLAHEVLVAAVGVDVQRVDHLPLGRLRRDLEGLGVRLTGQQDGVLDRAVGRGDAAFDGERAADAREQVLLLRERLEVAAAGLQVEERIGEQRHGLLRVPVGRRERDRARDLHDVRARAGGDRSGARQDRREPREVELARAGDGVGDELDLVDARHARDLDELALDEAGVEPALAVGADEAAADVR